jgi:aromatic ring-cleaving dioxygenase
MSFPNREPENITGWHAHIYYDPAATKADAARLRERIEALFGDRVVVGRWHDEHVGPHWASMYQIAFDQPMFAEFVSWMTVNREGLNVLIHPLTDNTYNDHIIFGFWMGGKEPLDVEGLKSRAARGDR